MPEKNNSECKASRDEKTSLPGHPASRRIGHESGKTRKRKQIMVRACNTYTRSHRIAVVRLGPIDPAFDDDVPVSQSVRQCITMSEGGRAGLMQQSDLMKRGSASSRSSFLVRHRRPPPPPSPLTRIPDHKQARQLAKAD